MTSQRDYETRIRQHLLAYLRASEWRELCHIVGEVDDRLTDPAEARLTAAVASVTESLRSAR